MILAANRVFILLFALIVGGARAFFQFPARPTTITPSAMTKCKILILPGFGNDSVDYNMPNSLVDSLKKRGWDDDQVSVLPVKRTDWLQVFLKGLFDIKFWQAQMPPTNPAFQWYLSRINDHIANLEDDENIILIGHSAGGWLGRAALGFGSENNNNNSKEMDAPAVLDLDKVLGIVTLGAPNQPPPPQVMDMTRGALRITNECFPGSYHAPSLFYLTVIGSAIKGQKQERTSPLEPTTVTGFAYNSYEAVCGDGTAVGDGVVPLCSAHVEDSVQINLDNVLHSINAPDQWYGADGVLDSWHDAMLQEIERKGITAEKVKKAASPAFALFQ